MTDKQLILQMIRLLGYETDNDGQVLVYTGLYEDIPDFRKNLDRLANIRWLWRNLLIRNRNHPKAMQAVGIAKVLMREKRKENQRVVTMPAIPEG